MATGTGKTYTAFQIIWRLWKAKNKKRILFLADRNILVDQTKTNDFQPFGSAMTKITGRNIDPAYEIQLALYQAITGPEEHQKAFKQVAPDFFDLIVIDECHRGSASEDSAWREILEYFSSATQIGLTATPKETEEVSSTDYFGEPVYTYSLKEGIEDGFLAPYKVVRVDIDVDLQGWRPTKGQVDKHGELIEDRIYNQKDFDRTMVIDERTMLVAQTITDYLKRTNPMDKTIVFCIEASELLAIEEGIDTVMRWSLPERLGSFALTEQDHILLMGFTTRLAFYDLNSGLITPVAASLGDTGTRMGDGRCDRAGNFVFGTMDDDYPVEVIGKFHRLNAATLTAETFASPDVAIPNSICFSPDGGTFYYCDSMQGRIMCCDYPSLQNQRVFTKIEDGGAPDGSCIDEQGYLWNAEWGGSWVVRYSPVGEIHSILSAPALQTTCPVLGGSSLHTLSCTSARVGLAEPTAYDGALFSIRSPFFAGLPESRFAPHKI